MISSKFCQKYATLEGLLKGGVSPVLIITVLLLCLSNLLFIILFLHQRKIRQELFTIRKNVEELRVRTNAFDEYAERKLLKEKRAHLFLLVYQIREAVAKQQKDLHPGIIDTTPRSHQLKDSELIQMLNSDELIIIQKYFSAYNRYIEGQWLNSKGKMKTIFRGRPQDLQSELGQLHHTSKLLTQQLDDWIFQLNSFS